MGPLPLGGLGLRLVVAGVVKEGPIEPALLGEGLVEPALAEVGSLVLSEVEVLEPVGFVTPRLFPPVVEEGMSGFR